MLNAYGATRDRVVEAFEALNQLADARGASGVHTSSAAAQERLAQNRFNLVVFGEFKRGKSTFINSLLGSSILPTAVVPLTSIITVVGYGEEDHAILYLQDGAQHSIALDELPAYITETQNPHNRKHVARVEVFVAAPLLNDGVQIVDTPGVGSVYEHNTEVTSEYLPNADAAIFVLTADPPISKSEREFLHEVRQFVTKIFFVQNKIDHLTPDELDQSLAFNAQVIGEEVGKAQVPIYPLSAKEALEAKLTGNQSLFARSRPDAFERALGAFLMSERGLVALQSGINAAMKAASDLRVGIEVEQTAIATPVEELARKLALFTERLVTVREQKVQDLFLLRQMLNAQVVRQLDEDLIALKTAQQPLLLQELEHTAEDAMHGNGAALLAHLNARMPQLVQQVLDAWQSEEVKRLSDLLNARLQPYTDKVNALIDQVHAISADVFAVHVEHFRPDQRLAGYSRFSVYSWQIQVNFELAVMPFLYLLPARRVHRLLLRAAWDRLWEQFDMHTGRLRYDFLQRMQASIQDYAKMLDAKVEDTVQGIEGAVRQAMTEHARGQAAIPEAGTRLAEQRRVINQVLETLFHARESLESSIAGE